MENKLFCEAVEDLLPACAEGLTKPETSAAVEAHLKSCGACRALYEALKSEGEGKERPAAGREIGHLKAIRKKSRRGLLKSAAATALIGLLLLALWANKSGMFHLAEVVYTEDRGAAAVVYDKNIWQPAFSEPDVQNGFMIRTFVGLTDSPFTDVKLRLFGGMLRQPSYNAVLRGPYRGSLWSPDGTMYAINPGNGEVALDNLTTSSSLNIHYLMAGQVKREAEARFGYETDEDTELYEGVALTALQWSGDSRNLLFYYELTDTTGRGHSGYAWYDVLNSAVGGLVENELP